MYCVCTIDMYFNYAMVLSGKLRKHFFKTFCFFADESGVQGLVIALGGELSAWKCMQGKSA